MNPPNQNLTKPVEWKPEEAIQAAVMTEAMSSRSVQEVQAALVVAKRFPRDEFLSLSRIKTACQRRELAEMAEYEYSRGGTKISGPTIDLLKAIASRWGNIEYGWQEIQRERDRSVIRAFAWDMQSNARSEMTFTVRHWRDTQSGGYALKDERDIYEATANFAARRVRACLENVIDGDIVQTAVDECRKTLKGANTEPLIDQARRMCEAFMTNFSVTPAMIEKRLGNKLEAISLNQIVSLRRVFKSLQDGVGTREDFFKPEGLVETAQDSSDDGDLGPIQPQPAAPTEPPADKPRRGRPPKQPEASPEPPQTTGEVGDATPQGVLAKVVIDAGFNFDLFQKWGVETGNIDAKDADSMASFQEVPTKLAERLLRARVGLVAGLAKVKKGEAV